MGGHFLRLLPGAQDDEEETVSDAEPEFDSGQRCSICGEALLLTEEVFCLELRQAWVEGGELQTFPLLDADGEPEFTSYIFHFECWESATHELGEQVEDIPALTSLEKLLECTECGNSITAWDPYCAVTFGELHASKRRPSGAPAVHFTGLSRPLPLCLVCVARLIDECFDDWEDGVMERLPMIEHLYQQYIAGEQEE